MTVKVHLYSGLKEFTNGHDVTEVHGSTLAECLADLVEQFPLMNEVLFNKDGQLSNTMLISINLESAYSECLENPVNDGDELYIVRIVAGG